MKKVIAIILAVVLVAGMTTMSVAAFSTFDEGVTTVAEAIEGYKAEEGVEEVPTYRYYFLQPNGETGLKGTDEASSFFEQYAPTWSFEGFTDAGPAIYWWSASDSPNPAGWVGYKPDDKVEGFSVYYADVPQTVTTIIWNNGVDGGMDPEEEIYYKAAQTVNIPSEYYDPGENPFIPEGTDNFDNMIFVVDPDIVLINEYSLKQTCGGRWYYYYGGSCFGTNPDGDAEHDCLNCAHEGGNHDADKEKEPVTVLRGDANMDGIVDVLDATIIQKYRAQLVSEDKIDLVAADVNEDGNVDVLDATRIQKYKGKQCNIDGSKPYDPENPINP